MSLAVALTLLMISKTMANITSQSCRPRIQASSNNTAWLAFPPIQVPSLRRGWLREAVNEEDDQARKMVGVFGATSQ